MTQIGFLPNNRDWLGPVYLVLASMSSQRRRSIHCDTTSSMTDRPMRFTFQRLFSEQILRRNLYIFSSDCPIET